MDQIFDKMSSGEAWLAPYYAGDAVTLVRDNPNIGFAIPTKEGTNFFIDAMCVPTSAKHKKEAEEYINFLCRPDVAAANMKTVGYSTPETEAKKLLPAEMRDSDIFYPPESIIKSLRESTSTCRRTYQPPARRPLGAGQDGQPRPDDDACPRPSGIPARVYRRGSL
jgi:spermidine/putrescine-binding protein